MSKSIARCEKLIAIDIDGTLIPNVIEWDRLRAEVREILGIDHELRPLAPTLASLDLPEDKKELAWRAIERVEIESLEKIDRDMLVESLYAIARAVAEGFCIALVTLRSRRSVEVLVEKLGIEDIVVDIVTRDTSADRSTQLRILLERWRPRCMVFVADLDIDMVSAERIGIEGLKVSSWKELPKAIDRAIELCRELST